MGWAWVQCSVAMLAGLITEDRPGQGGCRVARDLGKSSSGGSAARLYPGFPETPRFAEPSRPRHGASRPGAESCRCAERCPHIERSTLRAARSLLGNDGERSAVMPQTTDNAPRSCSGAGTLRDHGAERKLTAITGEAIPCRRNRARLAPREPHRVTLQGPGLGGPGREGAGAREATCLIMSHTTVSRTAAMLRDHARDRDHGRSPRSGHQRCSVITPWSLITETSSRARASRARPPGPPGPPRLPGMPGAGTKRGHEARARSAGTKRGHEARARSAGTKRGHEARARSAGTKRGHGARAWARD